MPVTPLCNFIKGTIPLAGTLHDIIHDSADCHLGEQWQMMIWSYVTAVIAHWFRPMGEGGWFLWLDLHCYNVCLQCKGVMRAAAMVDLRRRAFGNPQRPWMFCLIHMILCDSHVCVLLNGLFWRNFLQLAPQLAICLYYSVVNSSWCLSPLASCGNDWPLGSKHRPPHCFCLCTLYVCTVFESKRARFHAHGRNVQTRSNRPALEPYLLTVLSERRVVIAAPGQPLGV